MRRAWVVLPVAALLLCAAQPTPAAGQSAAIAQFATNAGPQPDPASDYPSRDQMLSYLEIIFAIIGVIVLVWGTLRISTHYSQKTDAKKYIMNDPWVQARLAQRAAPPGQPPHEPPA
jgi:hypothetical protein